MTSNVHVDKNTLTFFPDGTVSISTISGRIRARLCPGPFQKELLASGKRKECNLVLHPRRGRKEAFWELHIAVESQGCSGEENLKNLKADEIMGIDVGENNIAAVSTGRIWKAGVLKDKRDRYMSQRKRLQRNGSQSARQHLKKASGRERRHVTHVNNVVSKEIVQEAAKRGIKLIALEDLTHIRDHIKAGKRIRSRLHRWSFRELQEMIVYKAAAAGIRCVFLDPRYTSQTCSPSTAFSRACELRRPKSLIRLLFQPRWSKNTTTSTSFSGSSLQRNTQLKTAQMCSNNFWAGTKD